MAITKKWVGVSLPAALVKEIEEVIEKGTRGYTSIAEFAKEAIREKLDRIRELENKTASFVDAEADAEVFEG